MKMSITRKRIGRRVGSIAESREAILKVAQKLFAKLDFVGRRRERLRSSVPLSPEEREAIAHSKAAAARGEFATDEQVRAVWAKHGL